MVKASGPGRRNPMIKIRELVSTVGSLRYEEVDGVRKEKERLTTDHQPVTSLSTVHRSFFIVFSHVQPFLHILSYLLPVSPLLLLDNKCVHERRYKRETVMTSPQQPFVSFLLFTVSFLSLTNHSHFLGQLFSFIMS